MSIKTLLLCKDIFLHYCPFCSIDTLCRLKLVSKDNFQFIKENIFDIIVLNNDSINQANGRKIEIKIYPSQTTVTLSFSTSIYTLQSCEITNSCGIALLNVHEHGDFFETCRYTLLSNNEPRQSILYSIAEDQSSATIRKWENKKLIDKKMGIEWNQDKSNLLLNKYVPSILHIHIINHLKRKKRICTIQQEIENIQRLRLKILEEEEKEFNLYCNQKSEDFKRASLFESFRYIK